MSRDNLQNKIHNCQEVIYNQSMSFFDAKRFAAWLADAYKMSSFKSYAELGEAVNVSRATISNLIGAKDQTLTGKPSKPKPELVERLAKALNTNVDVALSAAGYAPKSQKNLIEVSEGVKVIVEDNFSDDQKKRLMEAIKIVARGIQTEEITYRPVTITKIYETSDITYSEQTDYTETPEKTLKEKVKE